MIQQKFNSMVKLAQTILAKFMSKLFFFSKWFVWYTCSFPEKNENITVNVQMFVDDVILIWSTFITGRPGNDYLRQALSEWMHIKAHRVFKLLMSCKVYYGWNFGIHSQWLSCISQSLFLTHTFRTALSLSQSHHISTE